MFNSDYAWYILSNRTSRIWFGPVFPIFGVKMIKNMKILVHFGFSQVPFVPELKKIHHRVGHLGWVGCYLWGQLENTGWKRIQVDPDE